jgi:hypothetical protein
MLSRAITSFAAAVTLAYGGSQTFQTVNTAAHSTSNIYAAAGGLLSADPDARASAEANMYAAAENLKPFTNSFH